MDIIGTLIIVGVVVGLLEIYRAHKNHVAFKTEASSDISILKDRIRYLELRIIHAPVVQYATAVNQNDTPPPTA